MDFEPSRFELDEYYREDRDRDRQTRLRELLNKTPDQRQAEWKRNIGKWAGLVAKRHSQLL